MIGRPILLNGESHTVIGVIADDFRFPNDNAIWVPASAEELADQGSVFVVARLGAGTAPAQAQAELAVIVTVCASYVPARRAAAVDPVSVLRAE